MDLVWLRQVRALRVLRFGTPVEQLRLFAGEHQAAQADQHPLSVTEMLVLARSAPPGALERRVVWAH